MPSSTNERQNKARRDQAERDRVTDRIVITQLMGYADGRRWLWNIMSAAQIFSEDQVLDPQYMAFEKGRRTAGLRILKDAQSFTPNEFVLMTNESVLIEAAITKRQPNTLDTFTEAEENPDE